MKIIFTFFLLSVSIFAEDLIDCDSNIDLPIDPHEYVKLMSSIWIRQTLSNPERESLEFSAENITVENDTITFSVPRINGTGIKFGRTVSVPNGKNFLGFTTYDLNFVHNAQTLCRNLGYGDMVTSIPQKISNRTYTRVYSSVNEEQSWENDYIGSSLATITTNVIRSFSCKLDSTPWPR